MVEQWLLLGMWPSLRKPVSVHSILHVFVLGHFHAKNKLDMMLNTWQPLCPVTFR